MNREQRIREGGGGIRGPESLTEKQKITFKKKLSGRGGVEKPCCKRV